MRKLRLQRIQTVQQRGDSIKWKYQIIIAQQKCGTHRIKMFLNLLEKNKWKLTDSLKEKIVDLAKKDAQDNVYMGNAFMNLRKTEVSKVAPNRAALIGKFSQSMNSGNMSAMKEVEEADKKMALYAVWNTL